VSAAAARPTTLAADPAGIPTELTGPGAVDWVVWRLEPKKDKVGEWTKEPYQAAHPSRHASSTNPATWSTFGEAFSAYQLDPTLHGVGRVLHGDGVAGIDLDNALDESGHAKPWARAIVAKLPGAHWERSPLGRGLRGIFRAQLPPGRRKIKRADGVVEMYDDVRYLTMTGVPPLDDPGDTFPVETLPDLQAEAEAVHAEILGGESIAAAAVVTELTGAAEDVTPDALRVLEAVLGGRYAAQMAKVWAADFADFDGDESSGEWALAKETVYHALQLGYEGDALALVVEQLMRAGPYRPKWDSPRTVTLADKTTVRTTWLGMTIGRAIKARERKHPELVIEEVPAPAVASETSEQTIARLTRELGQEKAAHARTRAASAVQATIIRGHNRAEGELRAEVERLNREKYAEWRLRRSKLKSAQVDTFIALTRIGTKRADWLDKDAPVITGKNIGDELGVHESTARANAEAVCNLPGSPIKRVTAYRQDGKRGQLTTYELPVRDRVELIERMVVVAEALDAPASNRPRPIRCPKHPKARVLVYAQHECSRCGDILQSALQDARPLCEEVTRIETTPAPVDVPVLYPVHVARIGQSAPDGLAAVPVPNSHSHLNGTGTTNGHAPTVATLARAPAPVDFWRCACMALERHRRAAFGDWVCSGCTMQVPSPDERP